MRVSAMLGKSFIRFDEDADGFAIGASGLFYDILKDVARNFNYTFSLQT